MVYILYDVTNSCSAEKGKRIGRVGNQGGSKSSPGPPPMGGG